MDKPRKYQFEFLDSLRGLAILAVMLLHFSERGRESGDELVHRWVWPILSHGYLGVQLFFVLSGYCIAAAMYGMRGKDRPVREFVVRRVRRIFPPYWWSMLLVVVLAGGTVLFVSKGWHTIFPMTRGDWLLNILLLQGLFGAPDVNLVYWSLSIEIQFYVLMAICLWSAHRTEALLIAMSVASGLLLSLQVGLSGNVFEYWPEFACGIAAFYWITGACRWRGTPWFLVGSAAVAAGIVWYRTDWAITASNGRFSFPLKLLFCISAAAMLICVHRFDSAISRRPLAKALAWLGTISYSLYLIHVPLATRVFNLGERATTLRGLWWLVYTAASFVVVLGIGALFYRYCEKPWLNSRAGEKRRLALESSVLREKGRVLN